MDRGEGFLVAVWPQDSVRVAGLGALCQAASPHPTPWGEAEEPGAASGTQLGAAESGVVAINVVSK